MAEKKRMTAEQRMARITSRSPEERSKYYREALQEAIDIVKASDAEREAAAERRSSGR